MDPVKETARISDKANEQLLEADRAGGPAFDRLSATAAALDQLGQGTTPTTSTLADDVQAYRERFGVASSAPLAKTTNEHVAEYKARFGK